jgi:hyaluronan synthase
VTPRPPQFDQPPPPPPLVDVPDHGLLAEAVDVRHDPDENEGTEPETPEDAVVVDTPSGPTSTSVATSELPRGTRWFVRVLQVVVDVYVTAILCFVWLTRDLSFATFVRDPVFAGYSLAVVTYVLARFAFAMFYRPHRDVGHEPSVTVIVPAFNEEDGIEGTIASVLACDYPHDKVEVIAVNDGSTDDTWGRMQRARARFPSVTAVDLGRNYGKRAAMAEGFRRSSGEVIVFVDSDSYLAVDALREIVQPFADPRIGTVAGHADVANAGESWLTRMQQVRYFSAFRIMKGTESLLGGTVTCASGCSSAYRRAAIEPLIPDWEYQRFLGLPATFGDDRALTNRVLKDWKVVYQSTARATTTVPTTLRRFLKQQLRWKKSWLRESLYLATYFWRKNKIAAVFTYASLFFPFLAPFVVLNAAFGATTGGTGGLWFYLAGTYAMAMVYSLYYAFARRSGMWHHGLSFIAVYMGFLVFQTYWGIVRMRDNGWGTRDSKVSATEVDPSAVTVLGPIASPSGRHAAEVA